MHVQSPPESRVTSHPADTAPATRKIRVIDLINTDKSAKELLDRRVTRVNATGRFENWIQCGPGPYVDKLRALGHQVEVIDTPRGLNPFALAVSIYRFWRMLRRRRFEIIHSHGSVIGVIARAAAFLARTPIVIHQIHGTHHHENMSRLKTAIFVLPEKIGAWVSDRILFQNRADMDDCAKRGIGSSRKHRLVGNGIQLGQFPESPPPNNDPPVILCVSRFESVKNQMMLLRAAKIMRDRGARFRVQFAGDGEDRPACESWARDHGVADRCEFLGYVDNVPQLTRACDVATLVSVKEGIPRAIMEAMSCGRPVVATRVLGNRDAMIDGQHGYLVELNDHEALARRLIELIDNPALRTDIGRRGAAYARENYDENAITDRIIAVYDELIARNP